MKWIVAVIGAAALLVGLPPLFGLMTEARVAHGLAELETTHGVSAELVSYDRGWFSSQARIAVDARAALPGAALLAAVMASFGAERPVVVLDFAHGPVPLRGGPSLGLARLAARLDPGVAGVAAAEQRLGVPYLFEFRGRINFLGTLVYGAEVPAMDVGFTPALGTTALASTLLGTLTLRPGDRLTFPGLDVSGRYSRARSSATVESDSLTLTMLGGSVSFAELSIDIGSNARGRTGTASFERVALALGADGELPYGALGVRIETKTARGERPGLSDVDTSITVRSLRIDDWELQAAELGVRLRNIDVAAIESLSDARNAPAIALLTTAPLLARLLAAAPSLTIDPLRVHVGDEPLTATVSVTANPAALPRAGMLDLSNPTLWLEVLEARAALEVAKPLALRVVAQLIARDLAIDPAATAEQKRYLAEAQAGLFLGTLLGQGVLVDSGETYRIDLQASGGAVAVNGRPFPSP